MSDQVEECVTKEHLDNQWNPDAHANIAYQTGLISPGYPLSTGMSEADRRKAYLQQCVALLKQALAIRKDETLMAEIRALVRTEQDALMGLLDDLG